jgi:hypothetical protein
MINSNVIIPQFRDQLNSEFAKASLPIIRGIWYYVDPYAGSDNSDGSSLENALANFATAYDRCTSGAGDGIVVFSGGTSASNTTSYLKHEIAWTKHAITVVGIAAPTGIFSRARIANVDVSTTSTVIAQTASTITRETGSFLTDGWVTGMKGYIADSGSNNGATFTITNATALTLTVSETLNVQSKAQTVSCVLTSYIVQMITVSGNNNQFHNISIWNGGTQAGAIAGVKITGQRNYFGNCHIAGGGGCTAVATIRSLELGDGAQENTFDGCTLGTDTVDRGNNANCELYINGTSTTTARNYFKDCLFLAWADGGTAHIAIKWAGAACCGRHMIFKSCDYVCFTANKGTWQASVFGGTTPTGTEYLISGNSAALGYTVWDNTSATTVFIATPAGSATGGIALVG